MGMVMTDLCLRTVNREERERGSSGRDGNGVIGMRERERESRSFALSSGDVGTWTELEKKEKKGWRERVGGGGEGERRWTELGERGGGGGRRRGVDDGIDGGDEVHGPYLLGHGSTRCGHGGASARVKRRERLVRFFCIYVRNNEA